MRRHSSRGLIATVHPGSAGERAGLQPGDALLSINGHILHDVIDYRYYSSEEKLEFVVSRHGGNRETLRVVRSYNEDLGLDFDQPTFDGIRRCRNRCDFCFIAQMPPGLRPSLYIRDDDYRYSFLFGSFVTLTNLNEEDWKRIGQQYLSPLYVSVHATDQKVRSELLGLAESPDIVRQIRRLGSLGITVHTQIVVTPGRNDGPVLTRTVSDLASLYPTVASIGIVPVGLTRFQSSGLRGVSESEARAILDFVAGAQRSFRESRGVSLVHASDELYLIAERPIPPASRYDGFPQLANGVGLTRKLLDDWARVRHRAQPAHWPFRRVTMVCGTLIAPTLRVLAAQLAERVGSAIEVVAVANELLGPSVTVSGLLTAKDVVAAVADKSLGEALLLPRAMFDADGRVTLDDRSTHWIEERTGVRVGLVDTMGAVLRWAHSAAQR